MQYRISYIVVVLSLPLSQLTMSCDWTENFSTGAAASEIAAPAAESSSVSDGEHFQAYYSPFAIRTEAEKFEVISFKDVGLDRSNPEPTDAVFEAIAQSLAYHMKSREELQFEPRVFHDESLADPSQHTHCDIHRVYVDLWRSESPDRWGYSLWSGCSESTKFAMDEVPMEKFPESADVGAAVEPLTDDIADSLSAAVENDCFSRSC